MFPLMGTWPDYAGMKTAEEFPWDAVFRMQGMSVGLQGPLDITNHLNMD